MQEIEFWYVIPAVRRALALEMHKLGMKSVDIAKNLGISKAAISQYFNNSRALEFKFDNNIKNMIKNSAERIIKGDNYAFEIQKIVRMIRDNGSACLFHHKKENLELNCDICFRR